MSVWKNHFWIRTNADGQLEKRRTLGFKKRWKSVRCIFCLRSSLTKKLNDLIEFGKVRDEWALRITSTARYEHNKQAKNEPWKMIHLLLKSYGSCRFIAKIRILAPFVWRERSTIQGVGVLGYRSARGETCIPKFKLHGAACWACCCRVTIGYTILENERRAGIRKCGKRQKREWTVNSYPTIERALFLSNLAWALFLVQLSMGASFSRIV